MPGTCHCACPCSCSGVSLCHLTELTYYLMPALVLICTRAPCHLIDGACDICLVEVKYPYTRRMSTRRDHSEYNPSGSPEHLDPWETAISREVPHSLSYKLFSLSKLCFSTCSLVQLTDLSIGVPLADTQLLSPLTPKCFSFAGDQAENDFTRLTTSSDSIGSCVKDFCINITNQINYSMCCD